MSTKKCKFILQPELISLGLFRSLRDFSEVVGLDYSPFLAIFPHFSLPTVFKEMYAVFHTLL